TAVRLRTQRSQRLVAYRSSFVVGVRALRCSGGEAVPHVRDAARPASGTSTSDRRARIALSQGVTRTFPLVQLLPVTPLPRARPASSTSRGVLVVLARCWSRMSCRKSALLAPRGRGQRE